MASKSEAKQKRILLKLSKSELIKKCKTYKLATTGSKSDMVGRILKHKNKSVSSQSPNKSQQNNIDQNTRKTSKLTLQRQEIVITGYLRSILNDAFAYTEIIALIISYFLERYAKYHKYDQTHPPKGNLLDDTEYNFNFGDIIRMKSSSDMTRYGIVDIHGKLKWVGKKEKEYINRHMRTSQSRCNVTFTIPLSICKHLSNAHEYFSKFDRVKEFNRCDKYNKTLHIKHDDGFIIDILGDKLDNKYKSIRLIYKHNKQKVPELLINFDESYEHIFKLDGTYSLGKIEEFYQLRQDGRNLTKIVIGVKHALGICPCYSYRWDVRTTGYGFKGRVSERMKHIYIGPKSELEEMKAKINQFYDGKDPDFTMRVEKGDR